MDGAITRAEHNEFVKRMEGEHTDIHRRLVTVETKTEQNNQLLVTVNRLALSMENMQREVVKQGERLEKLEAKDGEMWRKVVGYVITAVCGIVIGFVFMQIGM